MTYRYLITYRIGTQFGRVDADRSEPITSQEDVEDIQRQLAAHLRAPDVFVIAFSPFTDRCGGDHR